MFSIIIILTIYLILCGITFLSNLQSNVELLLDILHCEVKECKAELMLRTNIIDVTSAIIFILILPMLYARKGL
jgi:hypothetical protein